MMYVYKMKNLEDFLYSGQATLLQMWRKEVSSPCLSFMYEIELMIKLIERNICIIARNQIVLLIYLTEHILCMYIIHTYMGEKEYVCWGIHFFFLAYTSKKYLRCDMQCSNVIILMYANFLLAWQSESNNVPFYEKLIWWRGTFLLQCICQIHIF